MYSAVLMMALGNGAQYQNQQLTYPTNDPKCYCSCWGGPGCYGWSNCFGGRVCSGTYSGFYPGTQREGGGGCHGGWYGSYSSVGTNTRTGYYFQGHWYPSTDYLYWGTIPAKTIPPATLPGPVKRTPANGRIVPADEKPAPTPEKLEPAPKKLNPSPDKDSPEANQGTSDPEALAAPQSPALGNQAGIIVSLEADARLTMDGELTQQKTATRYFLTPPLARGKSYQYLLRADLIRDGQLLVVTHAVQVRPGEISHVVIEFSRADVAASR
jgi:uncharacterized protein (TIGR03000 family)